MGEFVKCVFVVLKYEEEQEREGYGEDGKVFLKSEFF